MQFRALLALGFLFPLSGCASYQLNQNTLELASTVGDIQTRQVLYNLSQFIDNPGALPSHLDLSGGSASTSNSITPNISSPLNAATNVMTQTGATIGSAITTSTTHQSGSQRASATTSISAQDLWTQNWSYIPIIDGDELRRLRSLYKYALNRLTDAELLTEYPIIQKLQVVAYSSGSGANSKSIMNDSTYCPDVGLKTDVPPDDFSRKQATGESVKNTVGCGSLNVNIQVPDEKYMREPGCILCLKGRTGVYTSRSAIKINDRLKKLHGSWLLTESDEIPASAVPLGRYGRHDFYVTQANLDKLSEFTIFVLTATAQSAAANPPSSGSQSSQRSKAAAPELFLQVGGQ
jgi:hypothetical protein